MTTRTKKGQFPKGVSGNPLGKQKGKRHHLTELVEKLFDGEQEGLARKAIDMALAGDAQMMRLCMERILPPRKDRPVTFDLGPIESATDHPAAVKNIAVAVSEGELTPSEGLAVSAVLESHRRAIETAELAERLDAIEERLADGTK